ncbi:hypothetical protein DCS_01848 [Drechmeria coniospora]|uniref:SPIN90/Ldb17 leucine-rich domain-containing protein n=1 Tax=Drechmeria coniospora TaxID=98403 RepID=A0A151GUF5_DRECN|nr:hypothetical protein DCS_01848 [Drechmeria coniospora]KYK60710.1 hypothetical protein DCS_01848 [Drechmeria coniospora]ODA83396.1 hypothetical protein RJ55_01910 [Drechmeria coniospora]
MADFDGESALSPDDEEQLWSYEPSALEKSLSSDGESHESIDDALRAWLAHSTAIGNRDDDPDSQHHLLACAHLLLDSRLFEANKGYVRTQIIHSLLQEDETAPLHAVASLLLLDGLRDVFSFPRMIDEGCFTRLLELIKGRRGDKDIRLHRLLLQLMYEMSRVERLTAADLMLVGDDFIHDLFRIIEGVSDDVQDPYHYPTIRVLLVLNEQYMLASTDTAADADPTPTPLTNRIIKCLSLHGPLFRTFGENIILLLNRETETSLQLLILKLLYLLFTTKATYEYFYTNDLRVLLDVIIRNLMDLPDEKVSLRHTYLRVMFPLLAHTQLNQPPHYKQEEILRVLRILRGSKNAHFAPADETTLRLVERVTRVGWLEPSSDAGDASAPAVVAHKFLGISLSPTQYASSISVGDVAGVMERPGVQTPSRHAADARGRDSLAPDALSRGDVAKPARRSKILPAVPKHRHGTPFIQVPEVQINGSGKKVPPRAPPPRRFGRKLKVAEEHAAEPSIPE